MWKKVILNLIIIMNFMFIQVEWDEVVLKKLTSYVNLDYSDCNMQTQSQNVFHDFSELL